MVKKAFGILLYILKDILINIFREQRQMLIIRWILLVSVDRDIEIQNAGNFSNVTALN